MRNGFVRASQLYDVKSQTPIAHPAHQATDADVRRALEDQEIRADGGLSSIDTALLAELAEVDNFDKDGPDRSGPRHFQRKLKREVDANPSDQEHAHGHRPQQKLDKPHGCIDYSFGQTPISVVHGTPLSLFHHGQLIGKSIDISFVKTGSGEAKSCNLGGVYRWITRGFGLSADTTILPAVPLVAIASVGPLMTVEGSR